MTTELAITSKIQPIVDLVLNDVQSDRTRRDYARALHDFMDWYIGEGAGGGFTNATVTRYVAELRARGVPDSSINQRLSAIRKLASKAADNQLLPWDVAQSIKAVKNIKRLGRKNGNWLNKAQAAAMINAPDRSTLKGKRDRAILAVMLGCGLRRDEVASLTVDHIQQRDARWVILNLQGKHNRVRTIGMAPWVKRLIDEWTTAAGITDGLLFRRIRRGGHIAGDSMTAQAIWDVVQLYKPAGVKKLAPHDLRRTYAKLARKGGQDIAQIQLELGHASLVTTQRYLGEELNLEKTSSDHIELDIFD